MNTKKRLRIPAFVVISFLLMIFSITENAEAFRNQYSGEGGRGQHYNSGPNHRPEYRPKNRPEYRPNHRPEYRPNHRPEYRPNHRPEYRPKNRPNHRPGHPPRYRPSYRPKSWHKPYYRPHYRDRRSLHIGLGAFFYPRTTGFYAVPDYAYAGPAVGTVVVSLPLGYSRISVGNTFYYHDNGTYYRQIPSGYVVADPPPPQDIQNISPVTPPPVAEGGYASVTTRVLNVRSGPGFHYPVLLQVRMGDSLNIKGKQIGWLYVQTSGGDTGWVTTRFTSEWEG